MSRRKSPVENQRVTVSARLLAGTALGLVLTLSGAMAADGGDVENGEVEEVLITGRETIVQQPEIPALTQPLIETPQSVSIVTSEILEDRAVGDLNDALRAVPGISLGAGEFTWQGNAPTIRGFVARSDMFLDGIRDFGNYYRDAFNIQQQPYP